MAEFLDKNQQEAIKKLKDGSILCGGVGSGKSRTSLAYYYKSCGGNILRDGFTRMVNPKNLYIITTAKKRDSHEWEGEMVPFGLSTKPGCSLYDITVVVDSWNNISKYDEVEDSFFIFDEQRVVGYGTWAKAFIEIAKNNYWLLLSATPGDEYKDYLAVFMAHGYFKTVKEFNQNHCIFNRFVKFPLIEGYYNTAILDKYIENMVVKMPSPHNLTKNVIKIPCSCDRKMYHQVFKQRWNPFEDEPIKDAGEACRVLRRIVNQDNSRLQAIDDIIEKRKEKRIILFYNFNFERDMILEFFKNNHPDYAIGECNGNMHTPVPDSEKWVYICQYTAAAEGWNCITTNCILFYSLNYSYKIMEQSSGRINRRNTKFEELNYYLLYSDTSIDKSIFEALKNKKKFNEKHFVKKKFGEIANIQFDKLDSKYKNIRRK